MKGFRVWSDYWKRYSFDAELYSDGSLYAMFEDDDGVTHHENTDLVLEFDTGLKDKNGKPIYGGDIVKYDCTGCNYIVVYRKYDVSFVLENDDREEIIHFHYARQDSYEVIGNRHENPELLEEAE